MCGTDPTDTIFESILYHITNYSESVNNGHFE